MAVGLLFGALLSLFMSAQAEAISPIVISEVQPTGCTEYQWNSPTQCSIEDGRQEFVELFNSSSTSIDVSGWRIEYLSASHSGVGAPTRVLAELQGKVVANSHVLLSFENYITNADLYFGADTSSTSGYLAKSGGRVRLVNVDSGVLDVVSWGSATQLQPWPNVGDIIGGSSAKRLLASDPLYNAAVPFVISNIPHPEAGGLEAWRCEGLVLSEVLSNPAGADTGNEFIEVFNPTAEAVQMNGCSLRLGASGQPFHFSHQTIEAGKYMKLSDTQTGITLPNAAGGTVWLLSSEDEQSIMYPPDIKEGQAWAMFSGVWSLTTSPTPALPNIITAPSVEGGMGGSGTALPCPPGKYRHPVTKRCRLKTAAAQSKACKIGQVRNPATNRCRSATSATTTLTPCKAGSVRNPETNRCRSSAALTSALKPCASGQERNAETHRCRKILETSAPASFKVEKTPSSSGISIGWLIAGAGGVGVIGYGAYEWRREIATLFGKVTGKMSGPPSA